MPISPESDYCLNGSVSLLLMTADIDAGARRSRLDVDDIVDRSPGYRPGQPDFFSMTVTREVLDWRRTASPLDKAHMGWAGLLASDTQFNEAIGGATNQLIDLYLAGIGAPQDRIFARTIPEELADLRLARPEDVTLASHAERVLTHGYLGRWLTLMGAQNSRVVEGVTGMSPRDFAERVRYEYDVEFPRWLEARLDWPEERKATLRQDKRLVRKGRKAARKGIELYSNLFGDEGIRTFLRGDTMLVQGALFDYRVSKTIGVIEHSSHPTSGHIPYQLDIHNKAGTFLAGGCVFFHDTPVIDQIIGLSLHVREKETEMAFLRGTNMLKRSTAYYDDPLLPVLKEDRKDKSVVLRALTEAEDREFREAMARQGGIANLPTITIPPIGEEEEEQARYPASVREVADALRPHARRAVTAMLPNLLAIPGPVLNVMLAPPVRGDEFHRMQLPVLQLGLENTLRSIEA